MVRWWYDDDNVDDDEDGDDDDDDVNDGDDSDHDGGDGDKDGDDDDENKKIWYFQFGEIGRGMWRGVCQVVVCVPMRIRVIYSE